MAVNPFGLVQQQINQAEQHVNEEAKQPQFQPTLDKKATIRLANQYKSNPTGFNPQILESIQNHAAYHQVPFYPGDFNFGEAVMQFGKGFASGFTTLETGDHPDNEYENIARSLGHLVGFAPGILSAPLKALGAVNLAKGLSKVKSVPLYISGKATEKLGKTINPVLQTAAKGREGATATAAKFLLENKTGRALSHVSEGAFNLGLASGLSAWQGGVDAIMESTFHGAVFGGVFRTLGNVVNTGDKASDTIIRGMAGSVFQGLPATLRGATSAEQVYEYLLGAYFGAGEKAWYKQGAGKFLREMEKEFPNNAELDYKKDPTMLGKKWKNLHELEQAEVEKQIGGFASVALRAGRADFLIKELEARGLKTEGVLIKDGVVTEDGYKFMKKVDTEGLDVAFKESKMVLPEPEVTQEGVKVTPAVDRFTKKMKDLDVSISTNTQELNKLETSLQTELKKAEDKQDPIRISFAKDKTEELRKNIDTDLLEKEALDKSIKRIGVELESFVEKANDDDVGTVNTEGSYDIVGPRALHFVENNLKPLWDVKGLPAQSRTDLKTVAAKELTNVLVKHVKRGKSPDTKKIMEDISTKFEIDVKPEESEGGIRQWMTALNKGHKQKFTRVVYSPEVKDAEGKVVKPSNIKVEEFDPKLPYSAGGSRKLAVEPLKLIEQVYIDNGGKVGKTSVEALITLDHITIKGKDKKLSDLRKDVESKIIYEEVVSRIQKEMANKDMYMFGGRGDADKLFFVKFHPKTKKLPVNINSYLNNKVFNKPSYREAKDAFVKRASKDMKKSEAVKLHKDAVVSNILYDLGMNGLTINRKNLREIWENKDGFLNNALAYNKRLQILFTPSWAGSREYAEQVFGKKGETPDKDFIKAGNKFKYIVIPDLKDLPKDLHSEKLLEFDAQLYREHVDGAIIGRNDVINYNNKDAGHPESGQNKAFIVSPEVAKDGKELGSMYGKFMFHKAGDALTEAMKKKGVHYIIHESSAKQMGLRQMNNYSIKGKNIALDNDSIYTLDPRHIKYNYSVKQSKDMYMHNARIPKQWFGQLNSKVPVAPIPTDVIEDIFNETIYKKYVGEKFWNTKLEEYEKNPTDKKELELLENIDKIGVNDLIRVVNANETVAFTDAVYQKLLGINKEIAYSTSTEDGVRSNELNDYVRELEDFHTVTDRLIKEGVAASKGKGVAASPIFAHKWIRPYRIQVMKNYIMSQITKPKLENSLAARMRPYDLALQQDFDGKNKMLKELKKRDDIFFLDDDYKRMPIKTHLKVKEKTLGGFWKALQDGKYDKFREEAEEVMRAMVIRVPMDSISGAHALKFMGFTGRQGHGVLMHPRSMRALGGADLDGDEAFVYFGGKNEMNEGFGMKKSWKDAYEANKNEYVQYVSRKKKFNGEYEYKTKEEYAKLSDSQKKRYAAFIPDNKRGLVNRPDGKYRGDTMEDLLTLGASDYSKKLAKDKIWMYAPDVRRQLSENVVDSRNLLGSVSTMSQTMRAAHDILSNTPTKTETIKFSRGFGKDARNFEVEIEARTDKNWLDYSRRLTSSMIAFTSDPMDVGGIRSYNRLFKELHDSYFKIKNITVIEESVNKKTGEVRESRKTRKLDSNDKFYEAFGSKDPKVPIENAASILRDGLVKNFMDLNSGLFSKNYSAGRAWKEEEVRGKLDFLEQYEGQLTNMLAKQGKLLTETGRWSANILNKLDIDKVKDLYRKMNTLAKRFKMEMQDDTPKWIETVMGRGTFTIPENQFIQKVLEAKYQPWTITGKETLITDNFNKEPDLFYKFIKDLPFTPTKYEREFATKFIRKRDLKKKRSELARIAFRNDVKDGKLTNKEKRDIVDEITAKAEDYMLTNDIHDMVSLDLLSSYIKSHRGILTDDVIKNIHKKVQEIKDNSYLAQREKQDVNTFYEEHNYATERLKNAFDAIEKAQEEAGVKKAEPETSAKMDQAEIDNAIREYKKTLNTAQEKKLFDYLMLGSYNRAGKTIQKIAEEAANKGDLRGFTGAVTKWYQTSGAKTQMIKIGFASEAIPSSSIRTFLRKYSELVGKTFKLKETEIKKVQEIAKELPEQTVKFEDIKVPFIEKDVTEKVKDTYVEDMMSYDNIYKQKLPKDQVKIIQELAENLKYFHKKESINLNEITAGVLGKPLNEMDKGDYIALNNFLKDIRRGSIWQRMFGEDTPDMRARYHMLFPRAVNKEMMKYDVLWLKKKGWFKVKGREVFGTIQKPSWWLEGIQDWISRMGEKSIDLGDKLKMEMATNLSFYVDNVENGETLRRFAVRKMERQLKHNITKEKQSSRTAEQRKIIAGEYETRYQEMWKDSEVQDALKKTYSITNPKGNREKVTGSEIVERISKVYKRMNEKVFKEVIAGEPEALSKYYKKDKNGDVEYYDVEPGETGKEPVVNWKLFVKDMANAYKKDGDIPTNFGIDGLRQIARSMNIDLTLEMIETLDARLKSIQKKKFKDRTEDDNKFVETYNSRKSDAEKTLSYLERTQLTKTGQYDFGTYFPHLFHSKAEARKSLERQLEFIEKSELPETDKHLERKKLMHRLNTLTGDWVDTNGEFWEKYDLAAQQIMGKRTGEKIKWTDLDMSSKNMMSRDTHLPGWSIDHSAYEVYQNNLAQTYFGQLNQIFTRAMIKQFSDRAKAKGWDKTDFGDGSNFSLLQKWENYLKLYAQDAMGGNSIIPDYIYNDPGMKISATPYGWWADNRIKKRMQKIKDAIVPDKSKYPNLDKLMNEIPYSTLRKISNLEAKFELASLLAHPKSAVGNVFGGSIHTLQSTGIQNWKQGTDLKFLRRINPEWKTKDDINRFIIKHGVIPDFMVNEWGLNPEVQKRGKQDFMKDVVKNMQDGKISRKAFNELMDKHKLSKSMMQIASSFMSKPEMMLRRQAFMAHYVQAWKRFDGAIDNIDHPFLIEQAKKGVQATQFLYSAPFRPAFARTALGKIMTRFQLWQWNAIRFRNDIAKEAKIFGLKEGSPAFEKFKRTLQLDLFVFAMANVFMYSLFDTALPAPWNYIQDTADWIFGDEKERERTFMGTWPSKVAPLQLVTPPIARLPIAGLDAFIADDWTRFSNYHIYTMFPFGRILKDFSPYASNNLFENPMMLIDKFTGMPMYGVQRMAKQVKDEGVYKP